MAANVQPFPLRELASPNFAGYLWHYSVKPGKHFLALIWNEFRRFQGRWKCLSPEDKFIELSLAGLLSGFGRQ